MTRPRTDVEVPTECAQCGAPITQPKKGRRRKYCCPACKQAAYEGRHGKESWIDRVSALDPAVEMTTNGNWVQPKRKPLALGQETAYTSIHAAEKICPMFPQVCLEVVKSDPLLIEEVLGYITELMDTDVVLDPQKWEVCSFTLGQLVMLCTDWEQDFRDLVPSACGNLNLSTYVKSMDHLRMVAARGWIGDD